MSEYSKCAGGALKLKGDSAIKKKKKKNKEMGKQALLDHLKKMEAKEKDSEIKMTKAELKFQQQQEQLQKERILKQASMTHKQKVEEFNRHLDSLTEHFDIPKVSWTK